VEHPPGLRILLAEDNLVNREITLLMLSELGWAAEVTGDGAEAVAALRRQAHDVVLMDVQMPEMDGLQAAREIRRITGFPSVPWIIAMTANESAADREECRAAGMNDFLVKPVQTQELEAVLRKAAGQLGTGDREIATARSAWQTPCESLVDAYLEEARTTLAELRSSAGQEDYESVRRKAHYLKGSSMVVGDTGMTGLCRKIEGRAEQGLAVVPLLQALDNRLAEAASALRYGRAGQIECLPKASPPAKHSPFPGRSGKAPTHAR
jgi:CheY-like chemotaxis protein